METTIMISITTLIMPILMIGMGNVFLKNPPKDINEVYGYRTKRSMKNQETWDFAHQYCGKVWRKIGSIMLIISIVIDGIMSIGKEKLMFPQDEILIIILLIQTSILIIAIYPVEKALKKNFDEEGNRINSANKKTEESFLNREQKQ